jgi:hypothetical protein
MAGGSAKKIAAQNENVIKNLKTALLVICLSSLALRFVIFRRPYSTFQLLFIALPFIPSIGLYNYLTKLGRPVRDASGTLISPGADLSQGGITECLLTFSTSHVCRLLESCGHSSDIA